jgi:Xaa-Pro aminopeptidase
MEPMPGISQDEVRGRIGRLQALLQAQGLPALLAVGRSFYDRPGPVAYLSGHFPPFPNSVFSGTARGLGHAFMLVPAEGEPTLLVDARGYRRDLLTLPDIRLSNDLVAAVGDALRERGLATGAVGLAGEDILPLAFARDLGAALPQLRLESAEALLDQLRAIKSPAEQALLRRAAEIAGVGLRAVMEATEQEVCAAGTAAALAAGADFVRYLRVHSGHWSSGGSRWPQATERVMQEGDPVVVDIIGAYRGYGFDVNRTTVVGGGATLSDDDRRFLEAGHAATEAAVAATRAGATGGARGGFSRVAADERRARDRAGDGGGPLPRPGQSGDAAIGHVPLHRAEHLHPRPDRLRD